MNDEALYQSLRAKIDTYGIGFPATPSGVEIQILRRFFTPEEAEVAVHLELLPEPAAAIAGRMGRDPDEVFAILSGLSRKGRIYSSTAPDGTICFHAAPFMHGLAENNAGDLDVETAGLLEQYENGGFLDHFASLPIETCVRFVPVEESLSSNLAVATYNQVEPMLRSKTKIAAVPCYCRDKAKVLGEKSDLPHQVCFVFDWLADYCVERGQAPGYLSIDEALAVQKQCEEAGLVNMPTNLQTSYAMCHCDGKYCVVFRSIKKLPKPADAVASDYFMTVKDGECMGCNACIDICPMDAISDNGEGSVDINLDHCIGCGVCVPTCSVEALALQEKPEAQKKRKPVNGMEAAIEISRSRGIASTPSFTDTTPV